MNLGSSTCTYKQNPSVDSIQFILVFTVICEQDVRKAKLQTESEIMVGLSRNSGSQTMPGHHWKPHPGWKVSVNDAEQSLIKTLFNPNLDVSCHCYWVQEQYMRKTVYKKHKNIRMIHAFVALEHLDLS